MVAEDGGAGFTIGGVFQPFAEAVAIENVISQNQADVIPADEGFPHDESVRQAAGRFLHGIGELHAQLRTIPEQLPKAGKIPGRGDD